MDAIAKEETLLDPAAMFKTSAVQSEIDTEDAAYWNVEQVTPALTAEPEMPPTTDDALLRVAQDLGGMLRPLEAETPAPTEARESWLTYFDRVQIVMGSGKRARLRAELHDLLHAYPERVRDWLRQHQVVFPGCEAEVAARLKALAESDARAPITRRDAPPKSARKRSSERLAQAPEVENAPASHETTVQLPLF